jgi:hypothetical protein
VTRLERLERALEQIAAIVSDPETESELAVAEVAAEALKEGD